MARLYAMDGAHAVLAYTYYPTDVFTGADPADDDAAQELLDRYFDGHVDYVRCTFTAVPASGIKNADIGMTVDGSNFLLVSSTWHAADGKPLAYCKDYYCSDVIRFKIKTPANKESFEETK